MLGVIKNQKLMGLYHSKKYCPHLHKELRITNGEIHTIKRNIKKTNHFYCRHCIYMEAEEQGINCFEICPQRVCVENKTLPDAMLKDMEACRLKNLKNGL